MLVRLNLQTLEARDTPADLRIVTYNITASDGNVRTGLVGNIVDSDPNNNFGILDTIGKQTVNGVTRPADIFLLQETDTNLVAVNTVAALLNSYYGAGTYTAGALAGISTGGGTQGIVYRAANVDLTQQLGIGTANSSGMPRQALRYTLRPHGVTGSDFIIYNSHMKADTSTTDAGRRLIEVQTLRGNADAFPANTNVIFAGDYNMYSSGSAEPAYAEFFSAGNAKAIDVANSTNNWVKNSNAFVTLYTQAPSQNPPAGLVGGGLDDRFDYQLMSAEFSDGNGLEYHTGSYHVFGNNGSLAVNSSINNAGNTSLANTGLAAAAQQTVLNLLTTVSDHLPVVVDYTYPTTPPPTAVSSYAINGGTQRSRVTSITVTFNNPVPTQLTAANFSITGFAGTINVAHTVGTSSAVLTFSGTGTQFTSLQDGNYILTVTLSGVVTNTTFTFHRLFGDVNGDRTVDAGDFASFGAAFGFTLANSPFDFDNSGNVDAIDFGHFGARFGRSL